MSYANSTGAMFRRTAVFVARILEGARPSNLPIEQASTFESSHQPQDRQGPRFDDPAVAPAAGGSDHRVMERRTFLSGIAGVLLAAPLASEAQQAVKIPRIGVFAPDPQAAGPSRGGPA
jgi:hypothetical protein